MISNLYILKPSNCINEQRKRAGVYYNPKRRSDDATPMINDEMVDGGWWRSVSVGRFCLKQEASLFYGQTTADGVGFGY